MVNLHSKQRCILSICREIQVKFTIPYFDIVDPRLPDFPVPVAVRGTFTFALEDYKNFIKLNRLVDFDLDAFKKQIKDALVRKIKGLVSNIPSDAGIPVVQLERKIDEISEIIEERLRSRMDEFGVKMKHIDINGIEIDKESEAYQEVKALTGDITAKTMQAQAELNIKNMQDMQAMNADNLAETMRIQREEAQRAQRLQTETNYMGAHALNQQTNVLQTAASNLGQMGNIGGGDSMNPASMMTGMMMGGAMGGQMAGMMNNMGQQMQNAMNTPPPMPNIEFLIHVNGQQSGPFSMQQMQQMIVAGQVTKDVYVWKQGMAQWDLAGNVPELSALFGSSCPPPPPTGVPTPP